jgi:hypothetical protein
MKKAAGTTRLIDGRRYGYVTRIEASSSSLLMVNVSIVAGWGNAEFEYPAEDAPRIGDRIVIDIGDNLGPQS